MRVASVLVACSLVALLLAGCSGTQDAEHDGHSTTMAGGVGTVSTGASSATQPPVTTTSTAPTAAQPDKSVALSGNAFVGGDQDLAKGDLVRFTNQDTRPHTVTVHFVGEPADQLRHDVVLQTTGSMTDVTFADAGTYHVWCKLHGTMTSGMAVTYKVA